MAGSQTSSELPLVLYHYTFSPFGRRLQWYLALRGISYNQCIQPPVMPRPDLARLGIQYRRIPVMAIGRDVYLDTRLIIQKLEELYPNVPRLGSESPEHKAIQRLLEIYMVDGGGFTNAAALLPTDLPLLKDPIFRKDRADFRNHQSGGERNRQIALNEMKLVFEFFETGLLADGRAWILDTEGPTLADIEAVWCVHWMAGMPGALPADQVSATQFPKVYAWVDRFDKAVAAGKKAAPRPKTVSGEEAEAIIIGAGYNEATNHVDTGDVHAKVDGLKAGDRVVVFPLDTGSSGRDSGKLLGLNSREVVIETGTGDRTVRLHAPRHGFKVHAGESKANL